MKIISFQISDDLHKKLRLEAVMNEKSIRRYLTELIEKDLKTNKKEYIPLRRIKKNLEKDELKLRRKEAIVAKQKIMLFGVNNYVYDEEKEKKLAEDLDLLDGLRLSVQHCEDVMTSNFSLN